MMLLSKRLVTSLSLSSLLIFLAGCSDDIDKSDRYTFTGETIADYLQNNLTQYSDFYYIVGRAGFGGMLSSYGSYTCLLPTNYAVERYLVEKDSIYHASLEAMQSGAISKSDFVDTGIHSPELKDLSDSMAQVIARTHLIEKGFLTTGVKEGAIPKMNMNDRYLSILWRVDEGGKTQVVINNKSVIIKKDIAVENGVIQVLDAVLSPSTALLPDLIKAQDEMSIFAQALFMTGMDDSLRLVKNDKYAYAGKTEQNFNKARQCPYPKTDYYKYTALVESNAVFQKYGISTLNDLISFANEWYGSSNYSHTDYEHYTSRDNPLNRFISYHLLNRQLQYASGGAPGGFIMQDYLCNYSGFDSEVNLKAGFDRYDYFETMLPFTLLKVTKPLSNMKLKGEIVLNYAQSKGSRLYNQKLANHINVIVLPESRCASVAGAKNFVQTAQNGIIHCIDRILVYNENEMAGNILNERMRFDFVSLLPELTNNNVRWAQKTVTEQEYIIPNDYCRDLKVYSNDCRIFYLNPTGGTYSSWNCYQGDCFHVTHAYDFAQKLPPVPPGTYEIRVGYDRNPYRGVAQFYIDGKVTGIPIDLRYNQATEHLAGWTADTGDADADLAQDKSMHNRGFMKGPDSFCPAQGLTERDTPYCVRRIIATIYLGRGEHWIRFKNVLENDDGTSQFISDWLEIVPKSIITDTAHPEDRH